MISFFEKYNWISWVFVFLILSVIFYFSSLQYDPVPKIGFPLKAVIYHLGIFSLLNGFLMIALSKGEKLDWIFFAFLFSFFYAFFDEFHQTFIPGRSAGFFDIFIDGIGILYSLMFYLIVIEWRKR
ncbi:MAG: VanZ family protein [Candidatus Pacearchaeota archaeon]|nr:VanZ family protein [Candidatus Pacearchaeota archaeon]